MEIVYAKIKALEMKTNLGHVGSLERVNLFGYANLAQKPIKIISIVIFASKYILILMIMQISMDKSGCNANIVRNGFIQIAKF